ncbi:nucleotidyltransferase family protein [Candidatus Leptofilum sp.]|uniref:nucleotidyltransferase family protein n=1 Tax=Candidatus Leptofilum sp. TaxID=3241576 RepID=UPI003B5C038F
MNEYSGSISGGSASYEIQLKQLILESEKMMAILRAVRHCNPPDWLVGAGVIRNLVWDYLHGYGEPTPPRDIDVAFFDATDLRPERDAEVTAELTAVLPTVEWEATNQAAVHLWYAELFGQTWPPFTAATEAIATWPETATCTAVRLLPDDSLQIVAPFGLDDLFQMVLRRNPARVTQAQFQQRLQDKQIQQKWPRIRVIEE